MKGFFFFTFLLLFFSAFGQLEVNITSDHGDDTVYTCTDTTITFYLSVKLNGLPVDSAYIYWDFDDGDFEEGYNLDTLTHIFVKRKAYRVFVSARKDSLYGFDIFEVFTGLNPDFSQVHSNVPDNKGICSGDKVILTGTASEKKWKETRSCVRVETFPVYIDTSHKYISSLLFRNYPLNSAVDTGENIDSIGIYIENSAFRDIRITLECPTGRAIVLKDTGGIAKYMGAPVLSGYDEGQPYWYYFSASADITMNEYNGNDTLPSGVYLPEVSFDSLKGCPLDGKWYIKVEQTASQQDNGYAYGWALFFNDTIDADTLQYSNQYDLNYSAWIGDGVNLTSEGVADAYPQEYGNHKYYFYIKDNYGCMHDTSLYITVEKPNFTIDKQTVYIGDSIKVEDKTSWSDAWQWDFGDGSPYGTEKTLYHKYFQKDTFQIVMTVYSKNGCSDNDTQNVVVQPKPITIEQYNIFTPNGDGVNDVFSFFNTPDEKIIAANIEEIKGRIYNRYGEVVCKWDTPEEAIKGWDGTIMNKGLFKAPSGYYYYILLIKGKDGKKYEPFKGFIYLYRGK